MADKDQIRIRDQRAPGWLWCQNELIDEYAPLIGVFGVSVYMVLARRSRNDVASMWMSDIARILRCGRTRVAAALRDLITHGLIKVRSGASQGVGNTYLLCDLKGVHVASTLTSEKSDGAHVASTPVQQASTGYSSGEQGCSRGEHIQQNYTKPQTEKTRGSADALRPSTTSNDSRFKAITDSLSFQPTARDHKLLSKLLAAYSWRVEDFALPTNNAYEFRRVICNWLGLETGKRRQRGEHAQR